MKKTHIALIVDRSGSMTTIQKEAQKGVNNFVKTQKDMPDSNAYLTIVDFDDEYRVVYDGSLASAPTSYKLQPRGSTALRDAIGKTVLMLKGRVKKGDKVIVNIITDGAENASREWNHARLRELMDGCTAKGWNFEFVVSDIKTMRDAYSWGFQQNQVHTIVPDAFGITRGYAGLASASVSYRTDTDVTWDNSTTDTSVTSSS